LLSIVQYSRQKWSQKSDSKYFSFFFLLLFRFCSPTLGSQRLATITVRFALIIRKNRLHKSSQRTRRDASPEYQLNNELDFLYQANQEQAEFEFVNKLLHTYLDALSSVENSKKTLFAQAEVIRADPAYGTTAGSAQLSQLFDEYKTAFTKHGELVQYAQDCYNEVDKYAQPLAHFSEHMDYIKKAHDIVCPIIPDGLQGYNLLSSGQIITLSADCRTELCKVFDQILKREQFCVDRLMETVQTIQQAHQQQQEAGVSTTTLTATTNLCRNDVTNFKKEIYAAYQQEMDISDDEMDGG
jgi:hypothetical protein